MEIHSFIFDDPSAFMTRPPRRGLHSNLAIICSDPTTRTGNSSSKSSTRKEILQIDKKSTKTQHYLPKNPCSTKYSAPHSSYILRLTKLPLNSSPRDHFAIPLQASSSVFTALTMEMGELEGRSGRMDAVRREEKFGRRVLEPVRNIFWRRLISSRRTA